MDAEEEVDLEVVLVLVDELNEGQELAESVATT